MTRQIKTLLILCAAAPLWLASTARAADHTNLEEGLPTQVEDAYPTAYGNREFQLQGRYERTAEGKNQFIVDPRLEYGFARNWQARISAPFKLGSGDKTGSGDIGLEAFYNFNTESLSTPAFALSARADLPTGRDSRGVDTTFKFIATKTLGKGALLQRLHLNLIYRNNAKAQAMERSNRYAAIVGYSQRLNADTVGILDFVREQELEKGKTSNILEVGLRRQVTPLRALSLGAGFGIGQNSPKFRLTAGLQQSF
jgi:hypothetical protein